MPFKIRYKFKEYYTCVVTYEQFKEFKKLPIVKECEIIKEEKENLKEYKNEVQEAINLVAKNDTSHIRKLSELVS